MLQNPEEAVKEFIEEKPILAEIEQQIKYYQVIFLFLFQI